MSPIPASLSQPMALAKRSATSPRAPGAKRRRKNSETTLRNEPNTADPVLHRENETLVTSVISPESIDRFWTLYNKQHDEDEEEDQKEQSDEDNEDDEVAETRPIIDSPKSRRSFKPTSARCPTAALKKASSRNPMMALNLIPFEQLVGFGNKSTTASTPSKEGRKPRVSDRLMNTQKPNDGHKVRSTDKQYNEDIEIETGLATCSLDVVKQEAELVPPSTITPVVSKGLNWLTFSHKPIYLGEPGHGHFKSRIVFEADIIPCEQHYTEIVPANSRMTALQKLKNWRDNLGRKSRDGQLRQAERLIILNEHTPSMARNELSLYTDTLKGLGTWLKQFMPDSFIVLKTTIPANTYTRAGRFRPYMKTLYQLLETYPFHFSIELEDTAILAMNSTSDGLAFARNFVNSVEFFRMHGHLMGRDQKPFSGMKSKKKHNKITDSSIDPDREAKTVASFLPWIPELFARDFYAQCAAFPNQNFCELEFEQKRANPGPLMAQERIEFVASMDRSLFAVPSHAGHGSSSLM